MRRGRWKMAQLTAEMGAVAVDAALVGHVDAAGAAGVVHWVQGGQQKA